MSVSQQEFSNTVVMVSGITILSAGSVIAFTYGITYVGCTLATIALGTAIYNFCKHAAILTKIEKKPIPSVVH